MKALFLEYGQTSSIAGLHYAFQPKQSIFGRLIWFNTILFLTFLGIWLSVQNYLQWEDSPVLTTITSTGQHFENPSIFLFFEVLAVIVFLNIQSISALTNLAITNTRLTQLFMLRVCLFGYSGITKKTRL